MRIIVGLSALIYYLISFSVLAAFGPFDYTNPEHVKNNLPVVEAYHFNANVELLKAGMTSAFVADDLWYVIESFPNHHRALNSMAKLWRIYMEKNEAPPGLDPKLTPDYLFERAMKFSPLDAVVRMVYAIHLHSLSKYDDALKFYKEAIKLGLDSSELHYNIGLLYFKIKDLEKSLKHAQKAYGLNYPLPGLKNKLIRAGKWKISAPTSNKKSTKDKQRF